jgi:acetylglutamate/LysW-gamma-L-alpha-aminoadipate kinase
MNEHRLMSGLLLIKAGGGKNINWNGIARDIADLYPTRKIVLIHGASVLRDEIATRLGIPVKRVVSPSGVTSIYTDREGLDVFLMAYAGLANKRIVADLQRHGVNAVGLSGVDGRLWQARAKKEILSRENGKTKLLRDNLTGRVEAVNIDLLKILLDHGYLPVLCAPAITAEGEIVNTDNDWAAAVVAGELGIKKMIFLFEAPGLLKNADRPDSAVPFIPRTAIDEYLVFARGRMQKKLLGAGRALEAGVAEIIFSDGRVENPVREALAGRGTVIR